MFGFGKSRQASGGQGEPGPFGPYYLHELINSGGMAELWLATDQTNQTFALRRLHAAHRFDFDAKRRFLRGCEVLAHIHNHEFVIGYHTHGKLEGSHYLLMEYVEGSNLKLLMGRSDPLLAEHVGNILIDMALALEHVHESGYMHLDFKPENVMVTRNAGVRLSISISPCPGPRPPGNSRRTRARPPTWPRNSSCANPWIIAPTSSRSA